jgi:chemotaxis signal transduction protein
MANDPLELDERTHLERLCGADRLDTLQATRLLELRALALSARSSSGATSDPPRQAVVFRAGQEAFGIASEVVDQVRELGKIAPLPMSPAVVAGVIVHKAELVVAADLGQLLHGQPCARSPSARLIVIAQARQQLALLSDELVGVRMFDRKALTPAPSTFPTEMSRYIEGVTPDGVTLLSVEALLAHLLRAGSR